MPLVINNPELFAKHIEKQVSKGMSYMDAILDFCLKRDLEPESIVPYISDKMKGELEKEGLALHLLNAKKCDDRLPFRE